MHERVVAPALTSKSSFDRNAIQNTHSIDDEKYSLRIHRQNTQCKREEERLKLTKGMSPNQKQTQLL
jgi:hypothetical protein